MSKPLVVSFPVAKEAIRTFRFDSPLPHRVYHVYPSLSDYKARQIPDKNNPRSHDSEDLILSKTSKEIRETLEKEPDSFRLRNKGGLVIADKFSYDDQNRLANIVLSDFDTRKSEDGDEIRPLHGLADGGTTDRIIYEVQQSGQYAAALSKAQWHLEIVVFDGTSADEVDKKDVLTKISKARNTSQQVRGWSFQDLRGDWNWLKKELDSHYPNLIAYEEYADGEVTVLDILAILNLFHPYYVEGKAPTASYASKGTMLSRFTRYGEGFKSLAPVTHDILELYDYVFSRFNEAYGKLGTAKSLRRYAKEGDKTFAEIEPPKKLLFSDNTASLDIHKGLLFPVLASFRALLEFPENGGVVRWFMPPEEFWDKHGSDLVGRGLDTLVQYKHNPQTCGKDPNLYRNLFDAVRTIRQSEEIARLKERLSDL